MRITPDQEKILDSLVCERLASNAFNLRAIGSFTNNRNNSIVEALRSDAYGEDVSGSIAYYLVKEKSGEILFFFSLKCGLLFDEFIEGERLKEIQAFYKFLLKIKSLEDISEEDGKFIESLLEQTRSKKGIKKADEARAVQISAEDKDYESILFNRARNVGKTYSGVELVHFCANDEARSRAKWKEHKFDKRLGAIVFWQFVVPKVLNVMEHIGSEYLYLFAADSTEDESLVNYYRSNMNFRTGEERGVAIPLYDFACKFMYQPTSELKTARERFFASFNNDKDAV